MDEIESFSEIESFIKIKTSKRVALTFIPPPNNKTKGGGR
jgi:hypothetical protein